MTHYTNVNSDSDHEMFRFVHSNICLLQFSFFFFFKDCIVLTVYILFLRERNLIPQIKVTYNFCEDSDTMSRLNNICKINLLEICGS